MADETTAIETQESQGDSTEAAIEAAEQAAEAQDRSEQETQEREEAAKIDAFLRARGVPGYEAEGDDDDGVTDPSRLEAQGEDEGDEEPAATEEELMGRELEILTSALDEVEGKRAEAGGEEELSDAERGFRRREESRHIQQVQGENEQLRNYVNTLFSHMRQSTGQTPRQAASEADQTPEPDLFDDPNAFIEGKLKEMLAPHEERLQKLDEIEARQRMQEVQQGVRKAEQAWEEANPGYIDRISAYRRAFVAELQYFGMPLEQAQVALVENEKGILQAAFNLGINPAELLDRTAHRWIGSAANGNVVQREQAQEPQKSAAGKRPGKFDRAREAVNSAAAGSLSDGSGGVDGGEITVDTLLASGASAEQVHTVLSRPGGRQNFFRIMQQLERASQAPEE